MKTDDRISQSLLCARGLDCEIRAFIDESGDLVIMWWDQEPNGAWERDHGAKVPKKGLSALVEFLIDELAGSP